jgi:uncharacterized protein YjbJ (UPF0337 family)
MPHRTLGTALVSARPNSGSVGDSGRDEIMGTGDKAKHAAENVGGKAKEVGGEVRGDQPLKNRGKRQQSKSKLKQAGENVKDAAKNK